MDIDASYHFKICSVMDTMYAQADQLRLFSLPL